MTAFDDWKAQARQADILQEAIARGAQLKRSGQEWIGACVVCGGRDRFSVHPGKAIFNCRGSVGGDVIALVEHLDGVSFLEACEILTSEPPPGREAKPLTTAEQAFRAKRRAENDALRRQRKAEQERYEEDTREGAYRLWTSSRPIAGTIAQAYLGSRGIKIEQWPTSLRFHPSLPYPNREKRYPALVCGVADAGGKFAGVWRIYLREDGRKADVDNPKLGLGPCGGGAVRFGGIGPKIALAEGVETALSYWLLTGQKYPCWAALSTSGMVGFHVPQGVMHIEIAPDGDQPLRKRGCEYVPSVPAGRKAAETLRERLLKSGVGCTIAPYPPVGKDMNDLWLERMREVA